MGKRDEKHRERMQFFAEWKKIQQDIEDPQGRMSLLEVMLEDIMRYDVSMDYVHHRADCK